MKACESEITQLRIANAQLHAENDQVKKRVKTLSRSSSSAGSAPSSGYNTLHTTPGSTLSRGRSLRNNPVMEKFSLELTQALDQKFPNRNFAVD